MQADDQSLSTMDENVLVRMRGVHFGYGARQIIKGMDLDVPRGKVTTIMGPSGTGKTTILRLIAGEVRPQQGEIVVDGQCINTLSRKALYGIRKRMGMLFQSGALFSQLSVYENVAFPLREHTPLPNSMINHLVLMKLEAVGLRGARDLMPAQLSGGMARRVALARAIALDPMMVLYDEPFTGQDPITVGVIMQLIRLLNDTLGLTSVIVSHDVQEVTAISDHLYVISDGKVVEHGTPEQLKSSRSAWVQQFLRGQPDGPVPFDYPAPAYADDLLA